jgi:hypothetical protein
MVLWTKRKAIVGIGVTAIGLLAVACSGAPQVSATMGGFQASIGGLSLELPSPSIPLVSPLLKPATTTTTASKKDELIGAVHSGEGCPLALPQ